MLAEEKETEGGLKDTLIKAEMADAHEERNRKKKEGELRAELMEGLDRLPAAAAAAAAVRRLEKGSSVEAGEREQRGVCEGPREG
jgi:hypothetical protein